MPRNIWMEFKVNEQEFARAEQKLAENTEEIPENPKNAEWKILKEIQRAERIDYFTRGKAEFSALRNAIYHEVREEFRPRWAEFYADTKNNYDQKEIAELKARLVADQLSVLEPRRNAACEDLLDARQGQYQKLLDYQKEGRAELLWRQNTGLDPTLFLTELEERRTSLDAPPPGFRAAACEVTCRDMSIATEVVGNREEDARDKYVSSDDIRFDPVDRISGGIVAFGDALFTDLTNLGSARPVPMSAEEKADLFRETAENATKQLQQRDIDEEDERWRGRQRVFGE